MPKCWVNYWANLSTLIVNPGIHKLVRCKQNICRIKVRFYHILPSLRKYSLIGSKGFKRRSNHCLKSSCNDSFFPIDFLFQYDVFPNDLFANSFRIFPKVNSMKALLNSLRYAFTQICKVTILQEINAKINNQAQIDLIK